MIYNIFSIFKGMHDEKYPDLGLKTLIIRKHKNQTIKNSKLTLVFVIFFD